MPDEQHPKWSRVKLFMDCTVVLYMMLLRDPKFDENRGLKGKLEKVMTKVFKKMFQCFRVCHFWFFYLFNITGNISLRNYNDTRISASTTNIG